jgi:hypothetical protein
MHSNFKTHVFQILFYYRYKYVIVKFIILQTEHSIVIIYIPFQDY